MAVVVIIVLLAVFLAPTLSRMMAKSQEATCMGNLKALGIAAQQYIADNNGFLFKATWPADMDPYLKGMTNLWNAQRFRKAGFACPAISAMRGTRFNSGIYGLNYTFNNDVAPLPTSWPQRVTSVAKPSKAYLFTEAGRMRANGSLDVDPLGSGGVTPGWLSRQPNSGVDSLIWPHAGGRKNFVFLDGHVKSLSWSEVQQFNGRPSSSAEYREFHGLR